MSRDAKAASRFRGLSASERNGADRYSGLADAATGERRKVLTELAAVERRHAAHRAAKLTELGEPVPPADRPGLRSAVLSWLARRFCVDAVLLISSVPNTPTPPCIWATQMRPRRWPPTSVPKHGNYPNAKALAPG
jgi:hypothetical protein